MDVALVTGQAPDFAATIDAPLEVALAERGVRVHHPRWDDPDVDWSAFTIAVVRTAWDYTRRRDEFVAWASEAATRTALWNPAEVVRWNTHKSYLLELEERGAPVVPTAWTARGDRLDLAALLAARGWRQAVIKPAVASGSDGLLRMSTAAGSGGPASTGTSDDPGGPGPASVASLDVAQSHLDVLLDAGDVMVQPYLDAIEVEGEVSVILLDGRVTHAVRKRPVAGEFRVQESFGGRYERLDPTTDGAEPAALARWVVEAAGHDLLYARVDLLRDENGAWQLVELELTEPDLYLTVAPEVGAILADAILDRT